MMFNTENMSAAEINAKCKELAQAFSQEQDKQLASYTRCVLTQPEKDIVPFLRSYVESQRKEFDKFENSLPWEDE